MYSPRFFLNQTLYLRDTEFRCFSWLLLVENTICYILNVLRFYLLDENTYGTLVLFASENETHTLKKAS